MCIISFTADIFWVAMRLRTENKTEMRAIMKKRLFKITTAAFFVFLFLGTFVLNVGAASGATEVREYKGGSVVKEETYTSVDEAWNRATSLANSSNKVEIKLGEGWEHDKELRIAENRNITVDLNGYHIKRNRNHEFDDNGGVFYVENGATLTIKDSRPNAKGYDGIKGGVITGGASGDTAGGIHMTKNSSVYIEGGTIYECTTQYNGGAICMDEGSKTLEMRNCRIYFCQTVDSSDNCHGGGLYINDHQKTVLENMSIDSCYSEDQGGAIYFESKARTLEMKNVVFTNNRASDEGGAIFVDGLSGSETSKITATKCYFVNNYSKDDGGAIYIDGQDEKDKNPTLFKECVFRSNSTDGSGGAIYVNDDLFVLTDATITNNTAKDEGGGVYVDSYYDLCVKGLTVIRDNTSNDTRHNNLCLQEGTASTARVYSGGLYRGSEIYVSTTDDESEFSREITEYQKMYFHPEDGSIRFEKTGTVDTPLVASLFGNGSAIVIAVIAALGIIAAATALLIRRKRGKANV